eukprot:4899642-Ditylum_brightwellii.AAC.1
MKVLQITKKNSNPDMNPKAKENTATSAMMPMAPTFAKDDNKVGEYNINDMLALRTGGRDLHVMLRRGWEQ